ncbi:MAG TPA: MarR family transcriptional regulator [Streptosporangiaceae bacterium]|jgi:DNA-binding MarR family transcriptional regulator|nr:MarR family transcriptional regulator [Streptosporangiaceae bacterium]
MANVAPDDRELELLLTQLLRMVSPALTADDAGGKSRGGLGVMDGLGAPDPAAAAAQSAAETAPATTSSQAYEPLPALSPSEARALIELVSARGIAQGELATLLGLDKSTVSRLAAGLERKGWIRRGRDEGNQRYVRLYLTPQGGDVAARVWQAWQSRQARMLAALSADERAGLSAGLGGLVRVLAAEGLLSDAAGTGA